MMEAMNAPQNTFIQLVDGQIHTTDVGAKLLDGFTGHQQDSFEAIDKSLHPQHLISAITEHGELIDITQVWGDDDDTFLVTTASLSGLSTGEQPTTTTVPRGLQHRNGRVRVETRLGVLEYGIHDQAVQLVDPSGEDINVAPVEEVLDNGIVVLTEKAPKTSRNKLRVRDAIAHLLGSRP